MKDKNINDEQHKSLAYGLPTSIGLNENDIKPINSNVVNLEKKNKERA